ncbi:hypothetical protein A2714_05550 [Candidatus Woesebacteria bacterium RIFCSPHIGHO2_01_FULL_38_9]|uniref:Glycosyltransferase 2-like domain-containing protein n=2 Tax=Candidatus Woeseibacteriota TaxID=1752722 RepID=A0A1F7Y378_9BACT|nr:MAG: hypothetical protein A2714_05550 [Candidatus Woesebacteria bacterium RIFCSPHIGHO2_01_FULL_38_9]OGM60108.1 MAG: hypothetical protein A3A75_01760 [Candidatus Woesebacteria bacterium RIFCSPLOWO2_01_FULL_39_10]
MRRFSINLKMIDVSIIIISYNTKDLTVQCIKSILEDTSGLSKEIIVIDNGSVDGSVETIRNYRVKLIENKENLGFAKANNQGIKVAKGKYILLLNSDTKIKKGAVMKLIDFANINADAGVVGCRLINPDSTPQASVFRLPTIFRAIQQYWFGNKNLLDKYTPDVDHPVEVESLVMAAFLITPIALKKVGVLDERYFMYFEDLDYCRRVRHLGLKMYYLPAAEIVHHHGASGEKTGKSSEAWKRLIPSSKIYHGTLKHNLFNFILWSGQKWKNLLNLHN